MERLYDEWQDEENGKALDYKQILYSSRSNLNEPPLPHRGSMLSAGKKSDS